MSKKLFFDMHSWDTFNRDWYWAYPDKSQEYEWPPYLTAPIHYQQIGEQTSWRKIINRYLAPGSFSYSYKLSCSHETSLSITKLHDEMGKYAYGHYNEVWINCKKCGGTGEIELR